MLTPQSTYYTITHLEANITLSHPMSYLIPSIYFPREDQEIDRTALTDEEYWEWNFIFSLVILESLTT